MEVFPRRKRPGEANDYGAGEPMVAMAKKQREEADVDMGDDDVLEMWLSIEEEEKSRTTVGD